MARSWYILSVAWLLAGSVSSESRLPEVVYPPATILATENDLRPKLERHIRPNGSGGFLLPDGTSIPAEPSGGFKLPNGALVLSDGRGGVILPNGSRCEPDGAGGYLCP